MQDLFSYFVEYVRLLLTPFGMEAYAGIVASIPFYAVLYVLYLIIIRSIKVSFKKVGMPREATSGTVFGVRLFFFAVALLTLLLLVDDDVKGYILAGGALLGTAIGLAFSKALSNIVSGIYVLLARPFRVGDYIRLGESEGIVLEITLNYTRILRLDHTRQFVPNSMTIDSRLTNFRVRIDDYFDERGQEYHQCILDDDDEENSRFDDAMEKLRFLTKGDEVYRYTFDVEMERSCSKPDIEGFFKSVCEKWSDVFIVPPEYMFWSSSATTITYRFAFIATHAKDIFSHGQDFRAEVSAFPSSQ